MSNEVQKENQKNLIQEQLKNQANNKTEKKIKSIIFHLENCESIYIPFYCFKQFILKRDKKDNLKAYYFKATIKDNGRINYSSTYSNNTIHPLLRLNQYNDIISFTVIYKNNSKETINLLWNNEDMINNSNQSSKLIDFKTLKITIKPKIKLYNIEEVFKQKIDTKFKDKQGNVYLLKEENKIKYLTCNGEKIFLNNKSINLKFRKIKKQTNRKTSTTK